jgi:adenine-specific DNA-methyltransferase
VLDFFGGTGTSGQATWQQNVADGGARRFIMVQLPERLDPEDKEAQATIECCDDLGKPRNIAELTKERLRRAGKKFKDGNSMFAGDLGFVCSNSPPAISERGSRMPTISKKAS